MSLRHKISAALSAIALLAMIGTAQPARADDRCYGDWSDAAPIVAREQLRSARELQDMARLELGGDVVRIVLCEAEGGFVYRLVLRRVDGRIGTMTVKAAK